MCVIIRTELAIFANSTLRKVVIIMVKNKGRKGITEAEANAIRVEKVVRPITWVMNYPEMTKDGDIEVNVNFYMHRDRAMNEKVRVDNMMFILPRDVVTQKLKVVDQMDDFLRVQELGKISRVRDEVYNSIHLMLTEAFDGCEAKDSFQRYKEAIRVLYHDEECMRKVRHLVMLDTLMRLLAKPKCFQSEEIQTLFA